MTCMSYKVTTSLETLPRHNLAVVIWLRHLLMRGMTKSGCNDPVPTKKTACPTSFFDEPALLHALKTFCISGSKSPYVYFKDHFFLDICKTCALGITQIQNIRVF